MLLTACAAESGQLLSHDAMRHDLRRVGRILGDAHPNVGHAISRADWDAATDMTIADLPAEMSRAAYLQRVAGLLDTLQCGHVGVGPRGLALSASKGRVGRWLGLPVVLKFTTDAGIVIARVAPTIDSTWRGRTVTAIDGQPIDSLLVEVARLAGGSDGQDQTAARDRGLEALRRYLAWRDEGRDSFRITLAATTDPALPAVEIMLPAFTKANAKERSDSLRAQAKADKRARSKNGNYDSLSLKPKAPVSLKKRPIAYGFDTVRRVAVIELNSMSGYALHNFVWRRTYGQVLAKARRDGAQGIVLDLRGNGGGRVDNIHRVVRSFAREPTPLYRDWRLRRSAWRHAGASNQLVFLPSILFRRGESVRFGSLMRHGVRPSKKAYTGPMAVLIDSKTFSAATVTAAVLASSGRAPLLGQVSGGNYHETYAGLFVSKPLRRTGLVLRVPLLYIPVDVDPRRQPSSSTLRPALTLPRDRAHVLAKADLNLLEALEFVASRRQRISLTKDEQ